MLSLLSDFLSFTENLRLTKADQRLSFFVVLGGPSSLEENFSQWLLQTERHFSLVGNQPNTRSHTKKKNSPPP